MSVTDPDLVLARRVAGGAGAFTRAEAVALGLSRNQIATRVRRGHWIRLHPGVYTLAAVPPSAHRQYSAAALAVPGGAVSGLAAAHLWGFDGCGAVRPEVTAAPTANVRVAGVRVRRRAGVCTTVHLGIPITTTAQTLGDIVPRLRVERARRVVEDAVVRRLVDREPLQLVASSGIERRSAGAGLFRELVDDVTGELWIPDSVLEFELRRVLRRVRGGGEPEMQVARPWWKGGRGRFDGALEAFRVLVEADGRSFHARLAAFEEDRWRDATAAAHGYLVLRFTAAQLRTRTDEVVALIEDTGRHRLRRTA